MPTVIDDREFAENAAAKAMIQRVVAAAEPIAARLIGGEYRLVPGSDVTLDEVRTAVFMATGVYLREIAVIDRVHFAACGGQLSFGRTLEQGIETLFGFPLLTALGSRRWQQHRRHFAYDVIEPLAERLADGPSRLPMRNLRAALFHFWGFALARNERHLDRFMPLMGLLPRAIPLGELAERPGAWAVLVA